MMFDWKEYLELAKSFQADAQRSKNTEALLRSSISRAYYAAFNVSKNYLISLNYVISKRDAHGNVRKQFEQLSIEETDNNKREKFIMISANLDNLSFDRKRADYDGQLDRVCDVSKVSLKRSEEIINAVISL